MYTSKKPTTAAMHTALAYIVAAAAVAFTAWFPQRYMTSLKTPWYDCIRPSLSPPNVVFPIVWTTLYVLIGLVFARVLLMRDPWLAALFVFNLALNILWTYTYFGAREVRWSLLVIAALWLTIVAMMVLLTDPWLRWPLAPYLLWISFATVLNAQSAMKADDCRYIEKNDKI